MKKNSIICLCTCLLVGCEYTEQDRSRFYENCMDEYLQTSENFLDNIAIDCACKKWSLREDIKPKNKDVRQDQYSEEIQKCYSEPIKMNKNQRKHFLENCHNMFYKTYHSTAEILAYGGTPVYDIAAVGMLYPEIYKKNSNKDTVQCACNRLSLRDDFVIPASLGQLAKQYETAVKECKDIYK